MRRRGASVAEVAEARLFGNATPESVIAEAEERYGPFVARVCLFSGGNDSLATAHRCRDFYDELVWVNTGTAVPGVAEFCAEAADWLGKPLRVYNAPEGEYRRIVVGGLDAKGNEKQPLGFPGPMQHTRCYVNLKERAIEAMVREKKEGHLHRDQPHPMAWAKPLLNPAAHPGGIDLDLLAMRLEADLRASGESS